MFVENDRRKPERLGKSQALLIRSALALGRTKPQRDGHSYPARTGWPRALAIGVAQLSLTSGGPSSSGRVLALPVWAGLVWRLLGAEVHGGRPVNFLCGRLPASSAKSGTLRPCPPLPAPQRVHWVHTVHIARRYRQSEDFKFTKQTSARAGCLLARKPSRGRNATHERPRIRKTARLSLSLMSRASFTMGAVQTVYMGEGHAKTGCGGAHPISVTPASSSFNCYHLSYTC